MCPFCDYIAVGAGVRDFLETKKQQERKRRKKRAKKYREPGSATPFLGAVILFLVGGTIYEDEPWRDDWEMVRVWMGETPAPKILGTWTIVKEVSLEAGGIEVAPSDALRGSFTFERDGKVAINISRPRATISVSGKYVQHGRNAYLKQLKGSGAGAKNFPTEVNLAIEPLGDTNMYFAVANSEGLYVTKTAEAAPIEVQGWRKDFQ